MFDRDWKKIEDFVGSKTVIQALYISWLNNSISRPEVVPKILFEGFSTITSFHGYPSLLNALTPGYSPWDDTSMLIHSPSGGIMLSQDEYNLHGVEVIMAYNVTASADIGSKGVARISNSGIDGIGSLSRTISSSELSKQGKPG
ncbi:unnamed protein product [Camellia sinensis]